jgi:hypothetical protein
MSVEKVGMTLSAGGDELHKLRESRVVSMQLIVDLVAIRQHVRHQTVVRRTLAARMRMT